MEAEIRRLKPTDAAALKAIRLRSVHDQPDAYMSTAEERDLPLERYEESIRANPTFAAFDAGGRLIGLSILGVTARTATQTKHKCEIWSVYVAPEARGRGLARRLMEACITEARRLGFEAIVLTAAAHLTHVVALYESIGFTIYGTERGMVKLADGRAIDERLMELRLDQTSMSS